LKIFNNKDKEYDIIYSLKSDNYSAFSRIGNNFYIADEIQLCRNTKHLWSILYKTNNKICIRHEYIKRYCQWSVLMDKLNKQSDDYIMKNK
jgi:hypothetical protein